MKILCIGDSLTEGRPGHSYIEFFPKTWEVINAGLGGDTIAGVSERIKKYDLSSFNCVIIGAGGNDILLPRFYEKRPLWRKTIDLIVDGGSFPATDLNEYLETYKTLLNSIGKCKIVVLGISMLSEYSESKFNKIVLEYNKELRNLAEKFNIHFIDFYSWQSKNASGTDMTMSNSPVHLSRDAELSKNIEIENRVVAERKLKTTIDGVHLNAFGARALAELIIPIVV